MTLCTTYPHCSELPTFSRYLKEKRKIEISQYIFDSSNTDVKVSVWTAKISFTSISLNTVTPCVYYVLSLFLPDWKAKQTRLRGHLTWLVDEVLYLLQLHVRTLAQHLVHDSLLQRYETMRFYLCSLASFTHEAIDINLRLKIISKHFYGLDLDRNVAITNFLSGGTGLETEDIMICMSVR